MADPLDKQLVEAVLTRPRRAKADVEEARLATRNLRAAKVVLPKVAADEDDDDDDLDLGPEPGTDAGAVADQILAKLGMTAYVPAGARQALVDYFEGATNFYDVDTLERKVRGAVMLALSFPEFQVH